MKSVRIEFVQSRGWRWVWLIVVLTSVFIAALTVWRWQGIVSATASLTKNVLQTQEQIRQLSVRELPALDPKQGSAQQAATLLQRDLNAAFTIAENMQEPKVKLKSFNYEVGTNTLRLEYELDSMSRASSVSSVLNAGYENNAPWALEAASVISSTNGAVTAVRATWVGRLALL